LDIFDPCKDDVFYRQNFNKGGSMNGQLEMQGTPKKKGKGCLVAAIVFIVVVVVVLVLLGIFTYKFVDKTKDAFTQKFKDMGYEQVSVQNVVVDSSLSSDKFYVAQSYIQNVVHDGNLALLVQNATINDDVNGNIDFTGQTLTVNEDAHVSGNISLKAQNVVIKGMVDGEISGLCQQLSIRNDLMDKVSVSAQSINSIPVEIDSQHEEMVDTLAAETIRE